MHLIDIISTYSIIVPVLAGALLFRNLPKQLKTLCLYIFLAFTLEMAIWITASASINNLFLFHAFTYVEFIFLSMVFYQLADLLIWKRVILWLLLLFCVFSIVNSIFYESILEFNSNQRYVAGIMGFVLIVGYFAKLIRKAEHIYLERHPYFILAASYLLYFSGTFFLFLVSKEFMGADIAKYWSLHGVLNIFLNLSYIAVLWQGRKVLIT